MVFCKTCHNLKARRDGKWVCATCEAPPPPVARRRRGGGPMPALAPRPPREVAPPAEIAVADGTEFFPYASSRPVQRDLMRAVADAAGRGRLLVAHAPTGLGKTVSSLAPLVEHAVRARKRVFFLTSKQSHHRIAVETMRAIRQKSGLPLVVSDVIGKQDMCPRPEARDMFPRRFAEFCHQAMVHRTCTYYETPNGDSLRVLRARVHHVEELVDSCAVAGTCPHQAALDLAAQAHVVVCDFNYFFSDLRETMQERLRVDLADVILVVDEAHNLPDRIRDHLSLELNDFAIEDAADELRDADDERLALRLDALRDVLQVLADSGELKGKDRERGVAREEFVDALNRRLEGGGRQLTSTDYDALLEDLVAASVGYAERFKAEGRGIDALVEFLRNWRRERPGLARVFRAEPAPTLAYRMLDPALLARAVFDGVHAAVLMSGTLHPGEAARDVLGLAPERTDVLTFESPFPREKRLLLVDAAVTTSYQERSDEMFEAIAGRLAGVADATPGNVAAFFPSYAMLSAVSARMGGRLRRKAVVEEQRGDSKEQKVALVESLRGDDALLMGVMGGSLSEGYDFDDNLLKGVVVVGLPLAVPSLEVEALIAYYERKFGKERGRDYAYVYPAMNRVVQAAGRCIRSPTDRGVVVLMDKRFAWPTYRRALPPGFEPRESRDPAADVRTFWAATPRA